MYRNSSDNRYIQLDALRGLAAISVFYSHAIGMMPNQYDFLIAIEQSPLHIFFDGSAAVNLFFVLSGFCIALPYFRDQSRKSPQYFQFIMKRFFRLYPAYWIALILAYVIKMKYTIPPENFLSEWGRRFFDWNTLSILDYGKIISLVSKFNTDLLLPPSWSLVYEMRMAFALPLFIFIINKYAKYSIVIYIAFLVFSSFFPLGGVGLFAPLFILGIIISKNIGRLSNYINEISSGKYFVLFILGIVLYTSRFPWQHVMFSSNTPLVNWLFDQITSWGSALIIICFYRRSIVKFFNNNLAIFLGQISYSLYLIHFPLLLFVFSFQKPFLITLLVSFVLSVAISFFIYKKIEEPCIWFGKYLIKRYRTN